MRARFSSFSLFWILFVSLCFAGGGVEAEDQTLLDFGPRFDPALAQVQDADVTLTNDGGRTALRVETHHRAQWPGITLPAPEGRWDLSGSERVVIEWRNIGSKAFQLFCRVDNPGADGTSNCVNSWTELEPGRPGQIEVELKRTAGDNLGGRLFGMRGYPAGGKGPEMVNPSNITQILLFASKPKTDAAFEITRIRATGVYTPPTAWVSDADPFFPFIDRFGQYSHKDWPGKAHSEGELTSRAATEAEELGQDRRADWDKYGGWRKGPRLEATGFFRAQKYHGKWWLVDPDGRLFFSQGIDCVGERDSTPIDERSSWFVQAPWQQPEFASFLGHAKPLMDHYAGREVETFSFGGANLWRKYGADWEDKYPRIVQQRLRSWGINTIGNWSERSISRLRGTPYTDSVGSWGARMIEGSEGYWGKFPDVFDAGFSNSVERSMAEKTGDSAGDPWCLGYFSDNEMSWGGETSLAAAALRSPADQPAKGAFIDDLRAKYGDIAALNSAWGSHYESWDALRTNREAPDEKRAEADLKAFYTRVAEQYFRVVRDVVKAVAPRQLYLGCRFAWVNPLAAAAAAKFCDVVSYNIYHRSVADFHFNGGADVPLLIGEFHFGALDRGLFHAGLVPTANQQARAEAYRDYVLGAARHPQFVGCHWFQYEDEPVIGRSWDGENYQIGFVDVADTPYPEMVAACREAAAELYSTRLDGK